MKFRTISIPAIAVLLMISASPTHGMFARLAAATHTAIARNFNRASATFTKPAIRRTTAGLSIFGLFGWGATQLTPEEKALILTKKEYDDGRYDYSEYNGKGTVNYIILQAPENHTKSIAPYCDPNLSSCIQYAYNHPDTSFTPGASHNQCSELFKKLRGCATSFDALQQEFNAAKKQAKIQSACDYVKAGYFRHDTSPYAPSKEGIKMLITTKKHDDANAENKLLTSVANSLIKAFPDLELSRRYTILL